MPMRIDSSPVTENKAACDVSSGSRKLHPVLRFPLIGLLGGLLSGALFYLLYNLGY